MIGILAIGTGAGLAAALMFAAVISGTVFALPLFLLSPLPVAIATFGWGWPAGTIGAVVGGLAMAAAAAVIPGLLFMLLLLGPIVWVAHLTGLSRPAGPDGEREWFPLGRALIHATLVIAAAVIVAGLLVGFDADRITTETLDALEQWIAAQGPATEVPSRAELEPLIRLNIELMPYSVSGLGLSLLVLNAWLGARIAAVSGRLRRPWKPLWRTGLPTSFAWLLGGAILAAAVLPEAPAAAAGAVAGATAFALALSGLATLHALTIGRPARPVLLGVTYIIMLFFGLPIIPLIILGLVDAFAGLRGKRALGGYPE